MTTTTHAPVRRLRGPSGNADGISFRPWQNLDSGGGWRSLWVQQALEAEGEITPHVLQGPAHADVAIVGGGFTGLWTALRLRELDPSLKIAIVEADLCGTGASGRNGGAVSHWWGKLPTLTKLLGDEDGVALVRASSAAIDGIIDFIEAEGIDCVLPRTLGLWSATSDVQVGAWERVLATAERLELQVPYRRMREAELREIFPRGPFRAALSDDSVRRVQPAALARGLRRVALARGIEVYERSPVVRVESLLNGVRVETEQGEISAAKVVLAANAWMAHLKPFRPSIMVVSSDVVATEQVSPELIAATGLDRVGGFNSRMMVNYFAASRGRIFVGGGGGTLATLGKIGREFSYSPSKAAEIASDMRYLFPALGDTRIEHAWAGPIDRSPNGLPWFDTYPGDPRIHYGIGYAGHGVGATALAGKIIAAQLLGIDDEFADYGRMFLRTRTGAFPREPARTIGGRLVRQAVRRKEMAENAGHTPRKLDVRLAKLAPATLADSKSSRAPKPAA